MPQPGRTNLASAFVGVLAHQFQRNPADERGNDMKRGNTVRTAALVAIPLLVALLAVPAALRLQTAAAATCTTQNVLSGSNFEIDVNGNLKVDGTDPCIDWLAGGTGTGLRPGVLAKSDKPTGSGDDSFGKGTAEDDPNPTIVTGSIPPNKSDLKVFGVYTETAGSGKFLQLFWSRVQNPSGTTNMDFELNQKFCNPAATPTNCANNGSGVTPETPVRTPGDKLITYDLAKGGTVPTISIRTWTGSVWGAATVISGGANAQALGSVNTSTISAADSDGVGPLDPFTFGEASIAFSALFPPGSQCGTFGSAYLKSRSSDSFSAELKDFIAPEQVHISNCTTLTTNATGSVTIGSPISDTATLSGATADAGGTITFHLFSDSQCANEVSTGLSPVTVNGNGDYNSGNYTPTAVGTYYWTASYSGDANNLPASTACGDPNESSVVGKAPSNISTAQLLYPQDTVTVSAGAGGTPTGNVTFKLYGPNDTNCTGVPVYSETESLAGGSASTSNTSFSVSSASADTYRWQVEYSGDATHDGSTSSCGTEQFTLTIANS
jgi:hypothetical protein